MMLRIQLFLAACGCLFGLGYPLAMLFIFLAVLGIWGVLFSLTLFSDHHADGAIVMMVGVYYALPFFGGAALGALIRMAASQ